MAGGMIFFRGKFTLASFVENFLRHYARVETTPKLSKMPQIVDKILEKKFSL